MNTDKKITSKKAIMLGEKSILFSNTQHLISDYFKFKNDGRTFRETKEVVRSSPLTNGIIAQRQMDKSVHLLRENREAVKKWREVLMTNWQISKKKQEELRQYFIRFDGFIKENYDKRERAELKITNERAEQEKLSIAIKEITSKIEKYNAIETELRENVDEYQLYKDFLLKAASQAHNYADIKQIINRHEILAEARHNLGAQQANALETVQQTRQVLTNCAGFHRHTIITLNTELAELRERLSIAKSIAAKWDSALASVRAFAAEKAIQVQQVENSCWDLYKTMCQLQKEPTFYHQDDTENQLLFITERIKKVKEIYEMAESKKGKSEPSSNSHIAHMDMHI